MADVSLIEKAAIWAKSQGFDEIKADVEEYETPTQYTLKDKGETFTPNLTGMYLGRKNYVEVITKGIDKEKMIAKYTLLNALAKAKNGQFILLAPLGHKSFADKVVEDNRFNATVHRLINLK